MPKVLFVMSDYGHDPTETAVPYRAFKQAKYEITFVTETGKIPKCDDRMLSGWTQKLLGATSDACTAYNLMMRDPEVQSPKSWSDKDFSFDSYDIIFYPGGHEKSVRQVIENAKVQSLLAAFWPSIKSSNATKKAVVAICHGVLAVAHAKVDGTSVLANVQTTTLPTAFENVAYYSTSLVLGDYYKTFGKGTESTEEMVKAALANPDVQFKSSMSPTPFVVSDSRWNYLSGRFPADAQLLADRTIALFS